MTKIVLNGVETEVDGSKPLIHACHMAGLDVPMYCYHPGLSPVGSCRICQVEVKQGEAPARVVVACRTPVSEGMVVNSDAPKARETRRECLEFLLKNHPLDCPICDKAGECDLQDYAFAEGQGEGRSNEPRRQLEKRKSLGDTIVLDEERCIQCSRCVRFFEEVTGKAQLCVAQRGSHAVIETFPGRDLGGNYQGNVADLCPVGALTLKPFRFAARVWNLSKVASTCVECSRGCASTVEVLRDDAVKRFRPRYDADVNQWWMCDQGRFAFAGANPSERLQGAIERGSSGGPALGRHAALGSAREKLQLHTPPAIVLSPFATREEAAAARDLAEACSADLLFVSPPPNGLQDDLLHTGDPCPNRRGLESLGVPGVSPQDLVERLAAAKPALLVGERVAELIGAEVLAALPSSLRAVVFDVRASDAPCVFECIGIANYVEKAGTFENVDGHVRKLLPARTMPKGVSLLTTLLARLTANLRTPAALER